MRAQISAAFGVRISEECWEKTSHEDFGILDPSSDDEAAQVKCKLIFKPEIGHFQVLNPTQKVLDFLAIDHCMQIENEIQRCDFAIFDDTKICFADIKNVKLKKRAAARIETRKQLFSTIQLFKETVGMSHMRVEAIVVLTSRQTYPAATVASQDAKIRFLDELNAELLEGNQISF